MDRVLLCALLLGTAASENGSGLGSLWSSGGETTVGAPPSPQPEAAQGAPGSARLYDFSLRGPPLGDWPLFHEKQTAANDSHDAWEDAFDDLSEAPQMFSLFLLSWPLILFPQSSFASLYLDATLDWSSGKVLSWTVSPRFFKLVMAMLVGVFRKLASAAWNVLFAFLVLVFVLILTFILCGRCLLDRLTASFERLWASNNIIMRVFNRRSGNDYGAFEDTVSQAPGAERSRGSAVLEDAEPGCSGAPETTFTYRERTDSQATLEAEDTV